MDDGDLGELERLRARAYGPSADILGDQDALRRLAELEALARGPEAVEPDPPLVDDASEAEGQHPELTDDQPSESIGTHPSETDAAPDPPPAKPGVRWGVRAAWAGSLVVAVLIAVAVTTSVTVPLTPIPPVARDTEVRQVATLFVDPEFALPEAFGRDLGQVVGFQAFFGLRPVSIERGWAGPGTDSCGLVLEDARLTGGAQYFDGQMFWGCSAAPFPAAVNLRVTDELPSELRDAYPVGTALQFVVDGSRVAVFVAD